MMNDLLQSTSSKCLHSRKIISLLDSPEKDNLEYLTNHLSRCKKCTTNLRGARLFLANLDRHIPMINVSKDSEDEFVNDLNSLLKKLEIKEKELLQKKIFDKVNSLFQRLIFRS